MTYYILKNTAEPSVTGAYPQLELIDYTFMSMKKMQDIDENTFIKSNEDLAAFKFAKNAIKTDVLTCNVWLCSK